MFNDLMKMFFDDDFYSYNRPIMEKKPYAIKNYKDHTLLIQNVVGIKESDLNIDFEQEQNTTYLTIVGETKNEYLNNTFGVHVRYSVNKEAVKDVEWFVENGFLYVKLNYKEPAKIDVPVKKTK